MRLFSVLHYRRDAHDDAVSIPLGVVLFLKDGPRVRLLESLDDGLTMEGKAIDPVRVMMGARAVANRLRMECPVGVREIEAFRGREANEHRLDEPTHLASSLPDDDLLEHLFELHVSPANRSES